MKVLLWKTDGVASLTWSNLWKNRLVKQKLKVAVIAVFIVTCAASS